MKIEQKRIKKAVLQPHHLEKGIDKKGSVIFMRRYVHFEVFISSQFYFLVCPRYR
jgi:hypothetical protein